MKKILFFSALALLVAACHKEPYPQDADNEYLVYTSPSKDVNFASFKTFDLADSLLIIGQSDKPVYSQSNEALALIQAVRTNLENYGYIYTPSNPDADLGVQMTYIIKTERYVKYYNDPYWWLDYPGYWPSGYWGNWTGFYYPYPVTYTYTTNALVTDMVDLTGEEKEGTPLEVVWTSYIGGPAGSSVKSDVNRMKASIDQAFAQSAYLKK
ncbi:MAG: DUF4136 domain-containing protein [Bacteroidales bacterium]|nr:DUF4136 domain-containing protein [Bacteroidales bacterium]MBQ8482941.1 DUF4136 domain-containing protein [Bacteroidales bacterium]MBR2128083.1 DUF4136 domain-containing protein [Bacteroidales bacterium]